MGVGEILTPSLFVVVIPGHQDTVTSAVFTHEANQVVSGSDDRSARIWDLRNMRTPVAMIQSGSSVNRISVSQSGLVAIPFDNRNVRIYDLAGNRYVRRTLLKLVVLKKD